jgi:hypothetical protein
MTLWKTFEGRILHFEDMDHQHISNIFWFCVIVSPELYDDTTKNDIINFIEYKHQGLVAPYKPVRGFMYEQDILHRKGYLMMDNSIVIKKIKIGSYD